MDITLLILFLVLPIAIGILVNRIGPSKDLVNVLLSFSGAFLLGVAVLHVLPELYFQGGLRIGKFLLLGFLLQVVLEFFSKGIEHGHAHLPSSGVLPLMVLISLCIHSLIEGIPFAEYDALASSNEHNHNHGHEHTAPLLGLPLMLAVLLHKIPVAIALSSVLLKSAASKTQSYLYLLAFAMSFPAGVLLGEIVAPAVGTLTTVLAVAMGMLLHISMTIIFESSKEHTINPKRFVAMVAGMGISLLLLA